MDPVLRLVGLLPWLALICVLIRTIVGWVCRIIWPEAVDARIGGFSIWRLRSVCQSLSDAPRPLMKAFGGDNLLKDALLLRRRINAAYCLVGWRRRKGEWFRLQCHAVVGDLVRRYFELLKQLEKAQLTGEEARALQKLRTWSDRDSLFLQIEEGEQAVRKLQTWVEYGVPPIGEGGSYGWKNDEKPSRSLERFVTGLQRLLKRVHTLVADESLTAEIAPLLKEANLLATKAQGTAQAPELIANLAVEGLDIVRRLEVGLRRCMKQELMDKRLLVAALMGEVSQIADEFLPPNIQVAVKRIIYAALFAMSEN